MKINYRRFPELLFVDFSIRQKNKETTEQGDTHYFSNFVFMPEYQKDKSASDDDEYLHLIVMSGLDAEGCNIVFAAAIVQKLTYETICWTLFHFKNASMQDFPSDDTMICGY